MWAVLYMRRPSKTGKKIRTSMGYLKTVLCLESKSKRPCRSRGATSHSSRCWAEIICDTVLGAEVVDERIRRPWSCVLRHVL